MKATLVGLACPPVLASRLKELLERLGAELGIANCALSVMLTDDRGIQDFNRRFRKLDEPTDVLSFPAGSGDDTLSGHYLGDLVISLGRAGVQARELGHDLADEVEVLTLHGVLHLLGHDHEVDDGEMRALEQDLAVKLFGSRRGLITRSEESRGPAGGR